MEDHEMVCYCSKVTKGQILEALDRGASTLADIKRMTGACSEPNCKEMSPRGTCCGPYIREIVLDYLQTKKGE